MKNLGILCLVVLCGCVSAMGNEWYATVNVPGQNSDWYNSLNWSLGHVPTASETAEWRYAAARTVYNPIVISGGTAVSAASTCSIWYSGTGNMTVTNGAVYTINGNLNLYNSASTALTGVNSELTINKGSKVNVVSTGASQIGRVMNPTLGARGQSTLNIDGAGTEFNLGGYLYLGWSTAAATQPTRMNVANGAVATFTTIGGLKMNPAGTNDAVINLAGGVINIAGNRTAEVTGWLSHPGWIIGYDGIGTVEFAYDSTKNVTSIWSVPEPATMGLLAVGLLTVLRRKN
ncbi:MAG: hypothetical protein A2Y12_13530 [Planctomycetes bacterium GWF2_42_9]|nr:MAG: hypothetical protein A2Y12_13530 [Planctomycetes bacterium GWF2_42_9]